jgi:hypothetical protein
MFLHVVTEREHLITVWVYISCVPRQFLAILPNLIDVNMKRMPLSSDTLRH